MVCKWVLNLMATDLDIGSALALGEVIANRLVVDAPIQEARRPLRVAERGGHEARVVDRLLTAAKLEPPIAGMAPGSRGEAFERVIKMTFLSSPVDVLDCKLVRSAAPRHPVALVESERVEEQFDG